MPRQGDESSMSKTSIPLKVKMQLWRRSGGRCQYEGCNKALWLDSLTKCEFNISYIAHIYAEGPEWPRYDPVLSPKLRADITNLMVLCDEHHRLIDIGDPDGHPVERLQQIKRKHELRIEALTSIQENRQSHILLYGANVGQHFPRPTWQEAVEAMIPDRCPAERPAMELSLGRSPFHDNEGDYWDLERKNLRRQFADGVRPRLRHGDVEHLSVFGFAPQPLLMELGRLLSDIPAAEVFQRHREPQSWKWQEDPEGFKFIVRKPRIIRGDPALNLSLSATIDNSRITKVLGNSSVWTLTIRSPNNDFLKGRGQLGSFRETFRKLMDTIKAAHGHDSVLHVFPAVPVAVAVEIGRVWMPKADLPLRVWDENRECGGFVEALDI